MLLTVWMMDVHQVSGHSEYETIMFADYNKSINKWQEKELR